MIYGFTAVLFFFATLEFLVGNWELGIFGLFTSAVTFAEGLLLKEYFAKKRQQLGSVV